MDNMDFAASQARDDAAAILASAPSVLAKAAAFVTGEGPEPQIDWAKIAYLASQNVLSSGDRAFLGICAEIAGVNPDQRHPDQTFGARWDSLDGQHQSVIASVLTQSAQSKQAREREILRAARGALGVSVGAAAPARAGATRAGSPRRHQ